MGNSNKPHTTTEVSKLPPCDFCFMPAEYDGKTRSGPWANMCSRCFKVRGAGLGLGKGQRLVVAA